MPRLSEASVVHWKLELALVRKKLQLLLANKHLTYFFVAFLNGAFNSTHLWKGKVSTLSNYRSI